MTRWTFTSESVTEGHPDKMADQISDAILDAMLAVDPDARVACETLLKSGVVVVAGQLTSWQVPIAHSDLSAENNRMLFTASRTFKDKS